MPPDPVEPMRRQVRRLRGRRNRYEVERALSLLVAIAAGAGTAIVLLALRADVRLFAAGASIVALAALLGAVAVLTGTRRRWLGRAHAPGWIDRRAGLEGRLETLVELDRRGALPGESFFLPLLLEENRRRLGSWDPAGILPRAVPWRALGTALGTTAALLLALLLAPRLAPPLPELFYGEAVPEGAGQRVAVPGRVLLAPSKARGPVERLAPPPPPSLTAELQERIRRRLWGRDWEAAREAMARMAAAEQARGESERRSSAGRDSEHGDADGRWEIARSGESRGDAAARERAGAAGEEAGEREDGKTARPDPERRAPADEATGAGDVARGAGTATDPRLLGAATDPRGGRETFDLPIVARVRSLGGGPRPPAGEGPPAAPDARPDLGAGQRRDAPVAKMDVPPAYEDIVRHVFAHGAGDPPR
jgi:hypothetical protein